MMTAVGNDVGFDHIFVRQVIAQARRGDGLIGVSTSGNSREPAGGFREGEGDGRHHHRPVGLSTAARWLRARTLDHCLVVESDSIHRIQETHVAIYHILWDLTHTLLADERGGLAQRSDSMKYVDEFRDPDKARALAAGDSRGWWRASNVRARRPLQIMEVCGGHTHSIFRYGIQQLLPDAVEFVHGPGCPVCVLPMGRVDDCVALAERPEVIFTTFGDAMRVPGSKKSLLKAKADGADVRMVYSPLDALQLARENPRSRSDLLRPRLRDDDAEHRADGLAGARRGRAQLLAVLQSHHHHSRPSRRSSIRRICIWTASSVPGTSAW